MKVLVLSLLLTNFLVIINTTTSTENGTFLPSRYDNPVTYTIYRGKYGPSDCLCREYVNLYATCYSYDCKRFPSTFTTNLTRFKLATTNITNITIGDLNNLANIDTLEIEANNVLQWMEAGIFTNMTQLRNLSISANRNLRFLEDDLFEGLINLEHLSIQQNDFTCMESFSLSLKSEFMPNLRKLTLKQLRCLVVEKLSLKNLNGSRLEELDFVDSQISYIHPETLLPLRNLKVLNLGENNINATTLINLLEKLLTADIPLETLSLVKWGFNEIRLDVLEVISKLNLKKLILSNNQLDLLSRNTFPYMPHLETLYLNKISLSNLTNEAFAGLPNLKYLYMSKNKFSFVPRGALLESLQELDLSMNSNPRETASYFTLENYVFVNMSNLEKLNLFSNNIRIIPQHTFAGLYNLKYLNLRNSNIFFINKRSFNDLKQLTFLDLSNNPFPTRSFTGEIFGGLENLKILDLSFCKINAIPKETNIFIHLRSLRQLHLRGNDIKVINPIVLNPLINLEILNVEKNDIQAWHARLFQMNRYMKVLLAQDNKITYFSHAMLEDMAQLEILDFSKNPFNCVCESFAILSYFNTSVVNRIFHLIGHVPTKCFYPEKYSDYTIIKYLNATNAEKGCRIGEIQNIIEYLVPGTVILIVVVILSIIAYVYRWHIRYWIFLTKIFLTRRAQFAKSANFQGHDNYLYDAFVSYSSEDRNFVVRLVAMLENYEPFFKLCVYDRDFEIGSIISENVLECVSRSRKTLLVISNSYIKSQWCRWEAQVAENHRLFFENEYGECVNDSIVMIKLGTISQNNLSPMLKYLMKTRIYLQWDSDENKQKQFWEKLRNALAPVPTSIGSKKENTFNGVSKD